MIVQRKNKKKRITLVNTHTHTHLQSHRTTCKSTTCTHHQSIYISLYIHTYIHIHATRALTLHTYTRALIHAERKRERNDDKPKKRDTSKHTCVYSRLDLSASSFKRPKYIRLQFDRALWAQMLQPRKKTIDYRAGNRRQRHHPTSHR